VTHNYSWHCRPMFQFKSEHVRDIRWSPFHHDFFAVVTDHGTLHVYNVRVPGNYWAKIAAHAGEATTVDWHPTMTYVIATGGVDRTVKSKSLKVKGFVADVYIDVFANLEFLKSGIWKTKSISIKLIAQQQRTWLSILFLLDPM
jgi:WD40 repeat protein